MKYAGRSVRSVFDRRVDRFTKVRVHLFNAKYSDTKDLQIQVNPEFGNKSQARAQALKYARVMGRIPNCLRRNLKTVTIHDGFQPFGGGGRDVLIHTQQSIELYETAGILEETLVHEAVHAVLDRKYETSADWLAAQRQDPEFITTYARDNPTREDLAESFLFFLAATYRPERISVENLAIINSTIPARIQFFQSKNLNMKPVE
ncbi:MAG: hypothetical protein HC845_03625 [Akkermansiaceae bacterium]|nr:hypothetical protein [Akkermansiaceae bacterium]